MKKVLFVSLLVTLLFALISCGSKEGANGTASSDDGKTDPSSGENFTMSENDVTLFSPNSKLGMRIYKNEAGELVYTVFREGEDKKEIIGESALGMKVTGLDGAANSVIESCSTVQRAVNYTYLGSFSSITDSCTAATVTLKDGDYSYAIEAKVYDDGVAFRYSLPSTGEKRTVTGELTSFKINDLGRVWLGRGSDCYESEIAQYTYSALPTKEKLNGPITATLKDNAGYIVLAEGFVDESYIGTCFSSAGKSGTFNICGSWKANESFKKFDINGDIRTGWRIINYSADLGGIVTNTNIYSSALDFYSDKAPDLSAYSYVEPGKCTWSWINDRGVPFEPQIDYTLLASRLGFTYNIIDEGYMSWSGYTSKLKELGSLGDQLAVKQILWCWVSGAHNGYQISDAKTAEKILKTIAGYGMSGVKLDFFLNESEKSTLNVQRYALEQALNNKLIIDFHGVHAPVSLSVLNPNELTREGIRGLENMNRYDYAQQAKFFTTQFYTRLLAGHADFTPDANTAMQIASLVTLDSPLMVIASDPRDMLVNEAREMIKAIPTVWDRTVFLDGKIGSYVSVAKEKSGVWFVGGIAADQVKDASIDLSKFLGDGEYIMTLWRDTSTSKKEKIEKKVSASDKIELGNIGKSLGYVAMFTKLDIDVHGGEITGPINVKTAGSCTVKYTTDGSDPASSGSAKVCNGSIVLDESCVLRVAIVDGDGKGTEVSYRFNKITYNALNMEADYQEEKTVITLTSTLKDAKIYYTLDGSAPSESSALYEGPITVTEKTTLRAISTDAEGNRSKELKSSVFVRIKVPVPEPDVFLGKDYTEAVAGWDNRVMVDESMNRTKISIGGTNADNGTKFDHGISTNAIGYFVYDIPENAKRFVGVAGIDDSAYSNTSEGYKASIICTVYVDGKSVFSTGKLGQGQFELIDLELPEGAKQIKIHFGDAGDGITCDNASLANGGFILG